MQLQTRIKAAIKAFIKGATPSVKVKQEEAKEIYENNLLLDKNILLCGCGINIGSSIAVEMAKQKANIFFIDKDKNACNQLKQKLAKLSIQTQGFVCDITNTEEVEFVCSTLKNEGITIDILVNNIGIQSKVCDTQSFDLTQWKKVYGTNILGPMYLTHKVAEEMIAQKKRGSILFISSIHQWKIRRNISYSSSKAAIGMIIKELAIDLSPYKIRVNGIAPGWVREDDKGTPFFSKYSYVNNCSIPPAFIGRTAVYLAADYFSQYTTGTVIKIDDGMSLFNHSTAIHPPFE